MMLGGEVALWSEQADPMVMDAWIWPRASAMAEALWLGNRDETREKRCGEATDRLNEWGYRMVRRGIGAEPIQPLWSNWQYISLSPIHLFACLEQGNLETRELYSAIRNWKEMHQRGEIWANKNAEETYVSIY